MTTLTALADALTTSIQTRIADPAGWLIEARRLCEVAKLSTARCLPVPATLATIGFSIAQEAFAQGPAAIARVEAALLARDVAALKSDRDHEAFEEHLRTKAAYGRTGG
jgi:hypothetical protein